MSNQKKFYSKFNTYSDSFNLKYGFVNSFFFSIVIAFLFFITDNSNIPSKITSNYDVSFINITTFFIILLSIFLIVKFKIFNMLNHPLINKLDQALVILFAALLIVQVLFFLGYENMTLQNYLVMYIVGIVIFTIFCRILIVGGKIKHTESVVVDLKDVIEGKVDFYKPFLIREADVDYDLLSRGLIVDDLVNWINNYQSEERFVIGIEGKWGSGKSTLIKNVIKRIDKENDYIIIDDFEPWISENKLALLNNLLKKILKNSRLDIPDKEIDNVIRSITKLVLGKSYFSTIQLLGKKESEENAEQTINEINDLLKKNNTKIVFIIDNLDRLMAENVLLILNIIQNVLNLSNLVVILSYDKEELEKGLNYINISSGYLDKLVQKKVVIPLIDENSLFQIYSDTIHAIASRKEIKYNRSELDTFLRILANNGIGLREFKRFLNSVIIPVFNRDICNSLLDTLVIEFIRFSNFNLYNKVYMNSDYFISTDRGFGAKFSWYDDSKYDLEFNKFFDDFQVQKPYEWDLLALIFPTIKNFVDGTKRNYKTLIRGGRQDSKYIEIQKSKRISSSKFFDLYFTLNTNYESNVIDYTKIFVSEFDKEEVSMSELVNSITDLPSETQTDFFVNFAYFIEDLNIKRLSDFIIEVLSSYFKFGNSKGFLVLGTKDRVAVMIAELIERLDLDTVKDITNTYLHNPKYVSVISDITYWLDKSYTKDNSDIVSYFTEQKNQLVERITENDEFNLYSKELYTKGNAFKLLFVLRDNGEEEKFKKYVDKNLSEDTVYRILNDMVSFSNGTLGYSYQVVDNIGNYVDEKRLEELIYQVNPENEQQQFIKEVYDNYLRGEKDEYGDIAIRRNQPIELSKID